MKFRCPPFVDRTVHWNGLAAWAAEGASAARGNSSPIFSASAFKDADNAGWNDRQKRGRGYRVRCPRLCPAILAAHVLASPQREGLSMAGPILQVPSKGFRVPGLQRAHLRKALPCRGGPRHSQKSRIGLIRTSPLTEDQWLTLRSHQQNQHDCDIGAKSSQ